MTTGRRVLQSHGRERFAREARVIAALNHPGIVTVHSVEQDGDVQFLTMELVEGRPGKQSPVRRRP